MRSGWEGSRRARRRGSGPRGRGRTERRGYARRGLLEGAWKPACCHEASATDSGKRRREAALRVPRLHRRVGTVGEPERRGDAARGALAVLDGGHHELASGRVAAHPELRVRGPAGLLIGTHATLRVGLDTGERL